MRPHPRRHWLGGILLIWGLWAVFGLGTDYRLAWHAAIVDEFSPYGTVGMMLGFPLGTALLAWRHPIPFAWAGLFIVMLYGAAITAIVWVADFRYPLEFVVWSCLGCLFMPLALFPTFLICWAKLYGWLRPT